MSACDTYFDQRLDVRDEVFLPGSLPYFHSCEAVYLHGILTQGAIRPTHCPVYREDLLYVFYGRPAFKSSNLLNSTLEYMMPVSFMIHNDYVTNIHRAVAFDSGAYGLGLYESHLHKSMKLEQFHLTPDKDSLRKMIQCFYGSNERYFIGSPNVSMNYNRLYAPIECYLTLLESKHQTKFDDRKGSLEVQLNYEIPITKEAIAAVVLPKHLSFDPQVKSSFIDRGIPVLPITNYGVAPGNYYVHILELMKSELIKQGYLNDC